MDDYYTHIWYILKSQGKKNLMRLQWEGDVRFEDIIMSGDYYLTNLDLWLLAIKYNIPLILYSKRTYLKIKKIY